MITKPPCRDCGLPKASGEPPLCWRCFLDQFRHDRAANRSPLPISYAREENDDAALH